ncbi:outer membrane protein [Methylocystis parvus]|uniref:outer membrane protein n=1 Tax=Methylocystis parvus TaxID=134 RepID=UPI003C707342
MKKIGFGIVAAMLASVPAFAADLPSTKEAPVYAPPPPAFSWTGFYIGANIGGGWTQDFNRTGWGTAFNGIVWVPTYAAGNGGGSSGGGVVGGGQVGYNFQLTPMFVIGLEADFQGTSISSGNGGWWGGVGRGVDDFGTVRARVGLTMPGWSQLMVYGTGGFAYGDLRMNYGPFGTLHAGAIGWSAGGGVEYAVLPNWSVKAEYLFTDLGSERWGGANLAEHHVPFHTVRAGVNYRLNWGAAAPIMARY